MSAETAVEPTEPKRRTITLTNRPPVRIREDEWPVIASADTEWYGGDYKHQANRTTDVTLRVRRHADGRALVYGTYEYATIWQGERNRSYRAGVLLDPGADLADAIRIVGNTLESLADSDRLIADAVRECIADLPAEEL